MKLKAVKVEGQHKQTLIAQQGNKWLEGIRKQSLHILQ